MSSGKSKSNDGEDTNNGEAETCVVCFKNFDIYSIGECDHPVCYECSTRMRVLCQQNECPICRQGLAKVIFTYEKRPYRELEAKNRSEYYNKKYKICFYTLQIQKAFYELLDHPCPICNCQVFSSFAALKAHVRKEHEYHYCDLCTENLKIFSFERKCYNRQDLGLHRRKGDPDNTSHRGHPICEYCDERYLDRDELFRHLRRDHYYCHFCDADGSNNFYGDYDSLKDHFKRAHFVCEEGQCVDERFTGVFRTEIDLKAHIANIHGKSLDKKQVKQARTLQLEITLGPRPRAGQHEQNIANLRSRGNEQPPEEEVRHPPEERPKAIDARNEEDFPSLAGASNSANLSLVRPLSMRNKLSQAGLARTKENFPALGGGGGFGGGAAISTSVSNGRPKQPPVSSILKKGGPASSGVKPGGMVIHVSNRPNTAGPSKKVPNKKDFPALGNAKLNPFDDEDDLPDYSSGVNLTSVSAKHRSLVDDYVSVANNASSFQKIQLVQKENEKKKAALEKSAPKLNKQDFPSLSAAAPTPQLSWVRSQKQKDIENRKSKVSPAPVLPNSVEAKKKSKNSKTADIDNLAQKQSKTKLAKSKKDNDHDNKAINNNSDAKNSNTKVNGSKVDKKVDLLSPSAGGPPPGFKSSSGNAKPPPGFQSVILNSVPKSPNNLTFTSSMGEHFSIVPSYQYIQPEKASERNQELVTHFKNALSSQLALDEFRLISQKFREGVYKPAAYYEHCQAALKALFDDIFPELLVLLPDISKQQDLYLVHSQRMKTQQNNKSVQANFNKLKVCTVCKQVLVQSDLSNHSQKHNVDSNFPSLKKSGNSVSNKIKH